MTYRRKKNGPILVEAYCYNQVHENVRPDWFQDAVTANEIITFPDHAIVKTRYGFGGVPLDMRVELGDWVVKFHSNGKLAPMVAAEFSEWFEAV